MHTFLLLAATLLLPALSATSPTTTRVNATTFAKLSLMHVIYDKDPANANHQHVASHPEFHSELSRHPKLSLPIRFRSDDSQFQKRSLGALIPDVGDRGTIFTLATMSNDAYYRKELSPPIVAQESNEEVAQESNEDVPIVLDSTLGQKEENPQPENSILSWAEIPPGWGRDSGFGWDTDGLRGYIWVSSENELVVIALKGTDIFGNSSAKDRVAVSRSFLLTLETALTGENKDLLMFSCCCGHIDYSIISPVVILDLSSLP